MVKNKIRRERRVQVCLIVALALIMLGAGVMFVAAYGSTHPLRYVSIQSGQVFTALNKYPNGTMTTYTMSDTYYPEASMGVALEGALILLSGWGFAHFIFIAYPKECGYI